MNLEIIKELATRPDLTYAVKSTGQVDKVRVILRLGLKTVDIVLLTCGMTEQVITEAFFILLKKLENNDTTT